MKKEFLVATLIFNFMKKKKTKECTFNVKRNKNYYCNNNTIILEYFYYELGDQYHYFYYEKIFCDIIIKLIFLSLLRILSVVFFFILRISIAIKI